MVARIKNRAMRRWLGAVLACAAIGAGRVPAVAQFTAAPACAVAPDEQSANIRVLGAVCGTATFAVSAADRRLGELRIEAADGIYIRTVSLRYASGGGTAQDVPMPLHRLLNAGEATAPFPTTRAGLGLVSVTVDVNPPGYGRGGVRLVLTSPNGEAAHSTAVEPQAAAAGGDYVLIGSSFVHLQQLRDTIAIGRDKGRFDSLVIASRGNDVPVQSIVVVPVNGPAFTADIRTLIAPGTASGAIAIDPPDFLHEVTITYGTVAAQSRTPAIEVRGRDSENWLGKVGENRQYAGGWVMLGAADIVVAPHSRRTAFRIGGQAGPFRKLRFVARRGAVDLVGVTVDAGDGRQETLPVNAMLLPDTQSAPVTLSGSMPIGSVALAPRLNANSRLDAAVEVWAQY